MRFDHHLHVGAPVAAVWSLLSSVEGVAACIPDVLDIQTVEPGRRYRCTTTDRVGPFKVRFALELAVVSSEPPCLELTASGRDPTLGSHASLHLLATVSPAAPAGTDLHLDITLQVTGKLATLGQPILVRKFDEKMAAFAAALRQRLEEGGASAEAL